MTRGIVSILALALCGASAIAQAPAQGPTLTPLWTLTAGFASPESAYYHAASNSIFVSSINGQILDKDGNGFISRLSPDGKVVNAKWATGLNGPKGIRSVGNTLWVADIDEVVSIDIKTGQITQHIKIPGAQFLNDLATAPDGTVYVSDSNASKIFEVRNGTSSVFVEGADAVEIANGLLVDGQRLILGTVGYPGRGRGSTQSGHLFAFDRRSKQRTRITLEPVGGIDGIELDGAGGLLVTDVVGARLLHVAPSGKVAVLAKFSAGGADFGYIAKTRTAIVPFLNTNSVAAFDLTNSLK